METNNLPTVINPTTILEQAVTKGASVEILERLMALQERWQANQAKQAFDAAMAAIRSDLPTIIKDREVDYTTARGRTHYRYEDLHGVTEALSPVLSKHGLSFRWRTATPNGALVSVTCVVSHSAGHSEETTLSAAPDESGVKNSIQAIGSAVTYLQRYTLKAALGIAAGIDDDAQSATPEAKAAGYYVPPEQWPKAHEPPPPKKEASPVGKISEAQRRRFWAICKAKEIPDEVIKAKINLYGLSTTVDITKVLYDTLCEWAMKWEPVPVDQAPPFDDDARDPVEDDIRDYVSKT